MNCRRTKPLAAAILLAFTRAACAEGTLDPPARPASAIPGAFQARSAHSAGPSAKIAEAGPESLHEAARDLERAMTAEEIDLPGLPAKGDLHAHPPSQSLDGDWEIRVPLGNKGIVYPPMPKEWVKTKVPGNWALLDPRYFSQTKAVYRKRFEISEGLREALREGLEPEIVFKGVDYRAEVFLNGKPLGTHEGYFAPFSLPARGLREDGENLLEVLVESENPGYPYFKKAIKGVFGHHDARPAGGFSPGRGTADEGNTGGIWNSVLIRARGMAKLEELRVETRLSDEDRLAEVDFDLLLRSRYRKPREVAVRIAYGAPGGREIERKAVLAPGANRIRIDTRIENPRLWWTWDQGEPALYRARVEVLDDGLISDERETEFGIRRIAYDETRSLFTLNGRPVFQRGINYIPTQWLSTYSAEAYAKDLEKMKEANLNSVRVHAHVLPEEFYREASRRGLLVLADFPLIWGAAPPAAEAERQYRDFVRLVGNYPCVWAYTIHNEPLFYDKPLDARLQRLSRREDPSRPAFRSSPGDEHFYQGWYHSKYPDVRSAKAVLPTEYGAQAIPDSMGRNVPGKQAWPPDERAWRYRNFQAKPFQDYVGPYAAFKDLGEAVRSSQEYQYDLLKYVTEHFRRSKGDPTVGAYAFMFKDPWPAVTWGVVDHEGEKKLGYEALRESMAPLIVSLAWEKSEAAPGETYTVPVWLVSDLNETIRGKISYEFSREGTVLKSGELEAAAEAGKAAEIGLLSFLVPPDSKPGDTWELRAVFADGSGREVARNGIRFGAGPLPKGRYRQVYLLGR